MREDIFTACLEKWQENDSGDHYWQDLANTWGYGSSEILRQQFKRERKKRGYKKNSQGGTIEKVSPKILLFDTENSGILGFVWGLYDQNLSYDRVVEDWHSLCWSAKWLFNSEIMSDVITSKEAKEHNDKRITESMWKLLDEADYIVGHNAQNFDVKKLNTRFIKHGLPPPSAYKVIDTLLVARNNFAFTSNRLNDLCLFFDLPGKIDTKFDLWKRCFYGDQKALKELSDYNINDSLILEEVYLKLRPWLKGHLNYNLWNTDDVSVCPNCGGKIKIEGNYYTPVSRYDAFRCLNCGAIGRSKKNNMNKEESKLIVRN